MFESIPVADEADLDGAIAAVWASVFGARAVAYYRMAGLRQWPRMAIVVQPFVEAERSGVMFTEFAHESGASRVLIEHVEGDCQKLVSGDVDPVAAWLPRWPEEGDASVADAATAPLPGRTALELTHVARRLEAEFGRPQDVEWCLRSDELWLLQARPITVATQGPRAARDVGVEPLLRGLGASGGHAVGRAHLVFHIEDCAALERGNVLVTPMTNPDMVAAMRNSAAVVTDVGGMICHAAIVSRELGVPCVVGTGSASSAVWTGADVTVDGDAGVVYPGTIDLGPSRRSAAQLTWRDLWGDFETHGAGRVPLISTVEALRNAPPGLVEVWLDPFLDLALDRHGQAVHLGGWSAAERRRRAADYVRLVSEAAASAGASRVRITTRRLMSCDDDLRRAAAEIHGLEIAGAGDRGVATAVPLGAVRVAAPAPADAVEKDDPGAVFGTRPACRRAPMPDPDGRQPYFDHLPALRAAHENCRASGSAEYEWLDPRPEVVITPMLKSVVLPGMETVPRALGFADVQPMHAQWIECRFHFRADTFGAVLMRLQQATWDEAFLAGMLQRTRSSYQRLACAAAVFPQTDGEWRAASDAELCETVALWWRAVVDFFGVSFFIQAQGDDFTYPAVAAIVEANQEAAARAGFDGLPGVADLTAPTASVLTAEYVADLTAVKRVLEECGCDDERRARAAFAAGDAKLSAAVREHLERWFWMRERDPYFEPYDRPEAVIEKALAVQHAPPPDYAANAVRARLALSLHCDLAGVEAASKLAYAVGYGHHLALERENHHIVWLQSSYPFRRLCLEWERRLGEHTELRPKDVFFFELPELLDAVQRLPAPVADDTLELVRNRRLAYHQEARLQDGDAGGGVPRRVADYY